MKFNENPFSASRVVPCRDELTEGQIRHDETNSCFSQFCKCA